VLLKKIIIDYFLSGEAREEKRLNNSPPLRKITNGLIIQISARVKTAEIAGLSHIL